MEYVIYKGEVTETYELLSNGYIYYVPMNVTTEKAHKKIARMERNEKIWNGIDTFIDENMGKLGLIFGAIVFISIVLLSIH